MISSALGPRLVLFLLTLIAGCARTSASGVDVPSFRDVSEAPAAIQKAARAVVRIGTAGESATGSFISATGLLLTNNHVLGVDICPREGCYAKITHLHQRHETPQETETIFVIPQAIDVGLDMAVLQAYSVSGTEYRDGTLSTPDYLEFNPQDPSSLEGTHIHIVGHPEGRLKKWTEGEIIDSSGTWITSTAFTLPGSSGSPILGDDGRIVGILHRGPATQDSLTSNGADTYSIGTASAPLVAALSAPLPKALLSTSAVMTDDEVVTHEVVFRNAHASTALVGAASKPVLDSLAAACDKGLARDDIASPEDLQDALAACYAAQGWIECRTDVPSSGAYVCPADVSPWRTRFHAMFDRWRAFNGNLDLASITFALAQLESSKSAGTTAAASQLQQALADANAPFDFKTALYLAAFDVTSFNGTQVVDFVRGYAKQPHYELSAITIVSSFLWLNSDEILDRDVVASFLKNLAGDAKVAIGPKLYIEDIQYNSKLID